MSLGSGLCLAILATVASGVSIKVFRNGPDKFAMIDETKAGNPEAATFDDEIRKPIDFTDEYDELVPRLPMFEVHQFGKDIRVTNVPIVTRPKPYWSTPSPRHLHEKTWSTPDQLKTTFVFRHTSPQPTSPPPTNPQFPTTTVRPPIDELIPTEQSEPKRHRLIANGRRPSTTLAPVEEISFVGPKESSLRAELNERIHSIQTIEPIQLQITTPQPPPSPPRKHPIWRNPNKQITGAAFLRSGVVEKSSAVESSQAVVKSEPSATPKPQIEQKSIDVSSFLRAKSSTNGIENGVHIARSNNGVPVEIIMAPPSQHRIIQRPIDAMVRSNSFRLFSPPETTTRRPFSSTSASAWSRSWSQHFTQQPQTFRQTHRPKVFPSSNIQTAENQQHLNCRVLEAVSDGIPAADNDPTCPLKYPGFPADNSCKCQFHVSSRDPNGCARGFLYTCRRVR